MAKSPVSEVLFKAIPIVPPSDCKRITIYGMNDHDQVVGEVITNRGTQGFIWNEKHMELLNPKEISTIAAINNNGVCVGVFWEGTKHHAVRWQNGSVEPLIPQHQMTFANAINDSGCIAGTIKEQRPHAGFLLFPDKKLEIIRSNGNDVVTGRGINRQNQIILFLSNYRNNRNNYLAGVYSNGSVKVLEPINPRNMGFAEDINDRSDIVGYEHSFDLDYDGNAVLWKNGRGKLISTPGNALAMANGINNFGTIVGSVSSRDRKVEFEGFVMMENRFLYMTDINDRKLHIACCYKVNNRGSVLCSVYGSSYSTSCYLMRRL